MNLKKAANQSKQNPPAGNPKKTFRKGALWTVVCLWMFILGILVGRGTSPIRFDIKRLQDELAALKAAAVEQTTERYRIAFQEVDKQVDLGYYEALTDSKAELTPAALSQPESSDTGKPAETDTAPEKTEADIPKKIKRSEFQKKPAADAQKAWIIQVAATRDEAKGKQMVNHLKGLGFQAYLTSAVVPGKGTWYRIRVGGYASRTAADADLQRLKKERYSPMIVSP